MTSIDNPAQHLEEFLIKHVPLASAAALSVDGYDKHSLLISAPLEKNINDKGTAFGGSLYIVCVSAGWGMTYLKSQELGLDGDLVIAKAEIEYLSPLKDRLIAKAMAPSADDLANFQQRFKAKGKAALNIEVELDNEQGKPCVRFHGKYAIVKS